MKNTKNKVRQLVVPIGTPDWSLGTLEFILLLFCGCAIFSLKLTNTLYSETSAKITIHTPKKSLTNFSINTNKDAMKNTLLFSFKNSRSVFHSQFLKFIHKTL